MEIHTQSSLVLLVAGMFFGSPVAIVWLIISYKKWQARLKATGCPACADSDTGICANHFNP